MRLANLPDGSRADRSQICGRKPCANEAIHHSAAHWPRWNPRHLRPVAPLNQAREDDPRMMKIALAVSAAATLLAAAPTVTPAKALKMADGVDVQIGRDREYGYDRDDRQRFDRHPFDTTVGIGPGGLTTGPQRRCR